MIDKAVAYAKYVKKSLVAVVGVAAYLANTGLVTGTAQDVLNAVIAVGVVFGIYAAENGPKP